MLILLVFFALLVTFFYAVLIKPYKQLDELPGPSTFELIKNFYYYSSSGGILAYLQTLNEKYGPTVKLWMKPFKPIILTNDMEYVEKIYKSKELHISPLFAEMTFMGNGIATMFDYNTWKSDKQIIRKAISREYIGEKLKIYDTKYNEFLDIIRENDGKPFDVEAPLHRILLDTLMHTIRDPNVALTEREVQNYAKYRRDFFNLLLERMNSFRMMGILHIFTKNYKLMNERRDNIVNFGKMWFERFKNVDEKMREKNNLVYSMLNGGMPEDRIVDNINTLIQGGQDTSVIPLALGFHEMARDPQLQKKIVDEIRAVLGTNKNTSITLRDLDEMVYLQAFVKECIRCHQPGPYLDRLMLQEMEIDGLKIPKGITVMFELPGILRAEKNFENPLCFNPDRFLEGNLPPEGQKAFIVFGYGLKSCPGKNIALAAMKLLIAKILREFEIFPLENDYKVEVVSEIFYHSVHGIPVLFKKRHT